MTEPTPTTDPMDGARERLARMERESAERASRVSAAWSSPEAASIRKMVNDDGNVDFREFVSHCGGIMAVVAMVDDRGVADPGKVIPKVDELFSKWAVTELAGGITMTRSPRNRPYRPTGATRVSFPGDGTMSQQEAARQFEESQQRPSRTTAQR